MRDRLVRQASPIVPGLISQSTIFQRKLVPSFIFHSNLAKVQQAAGPYGLVNSDAQWPRRLNFPLCGLSAELTPPEKLESSLPSRGSSTLKSTCRGWKMTSVSRPRVEIPGHRTETTPSGESWAAAKTPGLRSQP